MSYIEHNLAGLALGCRPTNADGHPRARVVVRHSIREPPVGGRARNLWGSSDVTRALRGRQMTNPLDLDAEAQTKRDLAVRARRRARQMPVAEDRARLERLANRLDD